ncbi:MAG: flagellin N-terminal helical domain-containing protein [Devosia sp.]
MSDIVLSASVRQNLLSLQSTADLLATTQNRLATGNKVNTALDNPTNFFTAQSLNNRASDISNLLDGVSNGVQVLQAANTGISSLQKLIDSAKSVANQALQATVGYSTKSTVTSGAITGISADNLLGTGAPTDATFVGTVETNNQTVAYSPNSASGAAITATHQTAYTNTTADGTVVNATDGSTAITTATDLKGTGSSATSIDLNALNGKALVVNGKSITFSTSQTGVSGDAANGFTIGVGGTSTTSVQDILSSIDAITGTGTASTVNGGKIELNTGTAADINLTGSDAGVLTALGLSSVSPVNRGGGVTSSGVTSTAATKLAGPQVAGGADALSSGLDATDYLIVNGKTITFNSGGGTTGSIANNNLSIDVTTGTINDVVSALQTATGGTVTFSSGKFSLTTSTGADIDLSQSKAATLNKLGIGNTDIPGGTVTRNAAPTPQISGNTLLSGASGSSSDSITTAFQAGDTISVNGTTITFKASGASGNNEINITDNITTLLQKIDTITGATVPNASSISGGKITLHTGTASDLTITSSNTAALQSLGLGTAVSQARGTGTPALSGKTLAFAAIGTGQAVSVTFGTGAGQVHTLNDLNNALAADNLQASLDTSNHIVITTTNDSASQTIGTPTGSATAPGLAFAGVSGGAPVQDQTALSNRANLVDQYNNILDQIKTTAQDASYNGIDLLNGDQLKLTFNETGSSTLKIQGVNFDYTGLGLSKLTAGTDFLDNSSANAELAKLNAASSALRTEASALGSNLSIVQIRQDFSKNLINVLQTGASNLTLADTNEEAANSQALSTRQSIAVSALALANQSQQSVLQLLR